MSRHYAVTSYTRSTWDLFRTSLPPGVVFSVAQLEKCPDTGKLHVQAYIQLAKRLRFGGVKKIYNDDALHIEEPRGSAEQNVQYCTKAESRVEGPWTLGEMRYQGKRTDLEEMRDEIIEEKVPIRSLVKEHATSIARYPRFVSLCYELAGPPPRQPPKVYFIWGDSGSGKTRFAYDKFPDLYRVSSFSPLWFDGYIDQTAILFDDLDPTSLSRTQLLQLTDRYAIQVPIKGGFRWLTASSIFITSNYPPRLFPSELMRRLCEIIHMTRPLPSAAPEDGCVAGLGVPAAESSSERM